MLSLKEVKDVIREHLEITLGIREFDITFAVMDEDLSGREVRKVWRINVEYPPEEGAIFKERSLFKIDAESGDVLEFKKGWYWTY